MKNNSINSLRGLACILLVIYHVIGGTPEQGLHIENGFLRKANDILSYIRMPLFTFLSGYIYSLKPIGHYSSTLFLRSKARRLLLPMLTVGTLFVAIQYNVDSSNIKIKDFWLLHIVPVAHFWFVESLFVIFCLIVFLEKNNVISDIRKFLFLFLVVALMFLTVSAPAYFGLSGAIYLLPYFLFGLGIGRFNMKYRPFLIFFLSVVIIALILKSFEQSHIDIDRKTPIALFVGLAGCYLLISLNLKSYFLSVIGVSSYSIYLYHVFFSASSRMVTILFTNNMAVHLAVGIISAIIGSIALEKMLSKHRLLNTFFLGKRLIPLVSSHMEFCSKK